MLVIFCLEQVSIITTMLETSVVLDSIDQINTTGNVLETAVSNNEVSSFSIEKEETMVSYSIKTDADASLKHDS